MSLFFKYANEFYFDIDGVVITQVFFEDETRLDYKGLVEKVHEDYDFDGVVKTIENEYILMPISLYDNFTDIRSYGIMIGLQKYLPSKLEKHNEISCIMLFIKKGWN